MEHRVTVDGEDMRPIGSRAMLDDIEVRVVAVQIQTGPRVVYHVAWMLNEDRHDEWVERFELADVPTGSF